MLAVGRFSYQALCEILPQVPPEAWQRLHPLQAETVREHYGLHGTPPQSITVLAEAYGITTRQISRRVHQALRQLLAWEYLPQEEP